MTSRLILAVLVSSMGCASSASQTDGAAAPTADCGVQYAITLRNEGNTATASLFFTDAGLKKVATYVGQVGPKDDMTFFIRSEEPPAVWAEIEGARVFLTDRTAQQRFRLRMELRCDSP